LEEENATTNTHNSNSNTNNTKPNKPVLASELEEDSTTRELEERLKNLKLNASKQEQKSPQKIAELN